MVATSTTEELATIARRIRRHIVTMTSEAQSGHPGGSLSSVEILTAVFFGGVLNYDPKRPDWPDRDRFIMSKGHASPVYYATLAEAGYFPTEELLTFRQLNSRLQGHPKINTVPGIEMSAGSLGQGLSYSIGQCFAARLDGRDYRLYCLMGDGECQEGQVWEALMAAPYHGIDTITVIVDRNGIQNDWYVKDTMEVDPLDAKLEAFGWHLLKVDGHDLDEVIEALRTSKTVEGKPTAIIAKTVKGKGVSFMENDPAWHGKGPSEEELQRALEEIGE